MLILPSNMFYTVTLPATLWFFDKGKTDERILFIDARNIFTQIDRAHREFSAEHIQNIGVITQLQRGRRGKFVELVDRYFERGMEKLAENRRRVEPVGERLTEVLEVEAGRDAVADLLKEWAHLNDLTVRYQSYAAERGADETIECRNEAQRNLRETFTVFFERLHENLKRLDKIVRQTEKEQTATANAADKRQTADRQTKALKTALEELHREVKHAESFFRHVEWLQVRFPCAAYEDVTGLCKLAAPAEVREQDFSLNPGRYVGVVIEEDGKTEEEFVQGILQMNDELETLNAAAARLESVISYNVKAIAGDL